MKTKPHLGFNTGQHAINQQYISVYTDELQASLMQQNSAEASISSVCCCDLSLRYLSTVYGCDTSVTGIILNHALLFLLIVLFYLLSVLAFFFRVKIYPYIRQKPKTVVLFTCN